MLPELLFSVGGSMQDISRDDFSLLNGGCDKDVTSVVRSSPPHSPTPVYSTNSPPPAVRSDSPNLQNTSVKLEDSNRDLYSTASWHHPEIESSKLLLRNSDDPLISRGATTVDDDNPNELSSMVAAAACVSNVSPAVPISKVLSAPAKRNRSAAATGPRTRRKGTFKLRFHHQALPAEYLNHYEATQNQQNRAAANNTLASKKNEANTNDTVRSWLQKISEMQAASNELKDPMDVSDSFPAEPHSATVDKSPRRVVKYSDLPYMGEMTLENSKPRRGRKPKKADICHLIYKNYGTIFPGTPKDLVDIETKEETKCSLLEKRLSSNDKEQKGKRNGVLGSEEPLNLCLRDQSTDSVTISSEGEDSNGHTESNRTTPLTTPTDPATDALLAANLKMSLPNFQSALLDKSSEESKTPSTADSDQPPNYVYWPAAGIFIHPMALYYQKMINSGTLPGAPPRSPASSTATTPPVGRANSKKQVATKASVKGTGASIKKEPSDQPEPPSTPNSTKSSASTVNSAATPNPQPPQKRKRSAIFIPPMPAENTTSPATEVSICKFKFTGGAKPSLQEKKMLSVDSDGNYRYYSGTGDKSMRGYEFFPRESLQQSRVIPGVNCAGAFLNATGEKISNDIPPPSAGLSNELLQIPDSPTGNLLLPHSKTPPTTPSTAHHRGFPGQTGERRKRKSRRSLQREKLEQTFKEKGFLIQTQQLESAEGATYCKFRQLRKFTRYLFRSWKDYLPGELQQANAAAIAAAAAGSQNSTAVRNFLESNQGKATAEKSRKN